MVIVILIMSYCFASLHQFRFIMLMLIHKPEKKGDFILAEENVKIAKNVLLFYLLHVELINVDPILFLVKDERLSVLGPYV